MVSRFEAVPAIPNDEVRRWLDRIDYHAYNPAWLNQRADRIAQILWAALNRDEFTVKATEGLTRVAPHMLTHHHVDEWIKLLLTALGRAYDLHDEELQGRLYTVMGQGHTLQGSLKPAQAAYSNALNQAREYIGDRLVAEEIELMIYIGQLRLETYLYAGQFTPERIAEIRALAQRIGDPMLTASLYQALAAACAHRGESEQALGYGMTALGYWVQRGRPLEIARSAHALSMAYSRQMLLPQAEQMVEFAARSIARADNRQYEAIIDQQRGIIAAQKGEWKQAVQRLEAARAGFRALQWSQHEALVERSLALACIPQKLYLQAEASLNNAAALWEQTPNNVYERAALLATRAYLNAEQGQIEPALDQLHSALALCDHIPEMKARDQLVQSIRDDLAHYQVRAAQQRSDPA